MSTLPGGANEAEAEAEAEAEDDDNVGDDHNSTP
jgi:hypothetical protein